MSLYMGNTSNRAWHVSGAIRSVRCDYFWHCPLFKDGESDGEKSGTAFKLGKSKLGICVPLHILVFFYLTLLQRDW